MATVSDLIETTKRHLYTGFEEEKNRLNGAIDNAVDTFLLRYPLKGLTPGTIFSIDLEEMRVWETSNLQVVVERGVNGTSPAAHDNLSVVTVKPKFSNFRILQALNDDLLDLSSPMSGLYQVLTTTITYSPQTSGYDIPTAATNTILGVIDVTYDTPGPDKALTRIDGYALRRNVTDTTDFPSGVGLVIYEGGFPSFPVRITLAASFGQWTGLTQTHTTVGLPDTATDLPPLGAAVRLVSGRDIKRSFSESQGEPRRAEEVPVGAAAGSLRGLMLLRQQRIVAEAARLERFYPKMQSGY